MEQPNVPQILKLAQRRGLGLQPEPVTYFLGREAIVIGLPRGMSTWRKHLFSFLSRNAQNAGAHLGLMPERVVEIGGQVRI
jgi:KUP system potassium uptake protein